MRILMANNSLRLRGGSERVMFDEAAWLRAAGHEVEFFGPLVPGHADDVPFSQYMPEMPDYHDGSPLKRLRIARDVIYNKGSAELFAQMAKAFRPDVVHGHNIYGALSTSILDACEQLNLPVVLTLHDYKLICPSYRMLRDGKPCSLCLGGDFYHCAATRCHKNSLAVSVASTLEAYFNRSTGKYLKASRLLAPSSFLLDLMEAGGIPAGKLRLLRNGVAPPPVANLEPRQNFVLYAGRLSEEKGVLTLIAAMRGVETVLRIAGSGPLRPAVEAELQHTGAGNVVLEGHLSAEEMQARLRTATAAIVPSEWYENASMIVLEAMAQGTPVICSRIGGLPEQVEHGTSGLLFEPGDAAGLQRAIHAITASPELAARLGSTARQRVAQCFTLDQHGTRLLSLYQEAIQEEDREGIQAQGHDESAR